MLFQKLDYFSGIKVFLRSYTKIYRNLPSKCLENAVYWASGNGAVQIFAGKFVK